MKSSLFASIVASLFLIPLKSNAQDKPDITGYKDIKFGMGREQVTKLFGTKGTSTEFKGSPLALKIEKPTRKELVENQNTAQVIISLMKKFGGIEPAIDTLVSKFSYQYESIDFLTPNDTLNGVNCGDYEFIYRHDSLKQIRRNLLDKDNNDNILQILTEKYGAPKIKQNGLEANPLYGTVTRYYTFTFETKSGRVRFAGMTNANIMFDKIAQAPKSQQKKMIENSRQKTIQNGDVVTEVVDSLNTQFENQIIQQVLEEASTIKPIRLTYTDITYAHEAEDFTKAFLDDWRNKAIAVISSEVAAQKKKDSDNY